MIFWCQNYLTFQIFIIKKYLSLKLRQKRIKFSAQECILQRATLKVPICQTSSFIFSFFIPCKYVDNSHFPDYWSVQIKETDTKNRCFLTGYVFNNFAKYISNPFIFLPNYFKDRNPLELQKISMFSPKCQPEKLITTCLVGVLQLVGIYYIPLIILQMALNSSKIPIVNLYRNIFCFFLFTMTRERRRINHEVNGKK